MSHEPIILDRETWPEAHAMVQYSLNRLTNNQHEIRGDINARLLQMEAEACRVEGLCNTNSTRLAVLEAKVIFYGAVAGAAGMAVMHWVIGKF